MSAIIPFDFNAPVAAVRRQSSRNAEVMLPTSGFASISIKGKVFAIVKGDERKPLMRVVDGDQIPVAALRLGVIRANTKSRVFYAKGYTEGDSDGAKPTCFSHDGQFPDPAAEAPQSKNCQMCPHAVWGTKVGANGQADKGTACSPNTRLAVYDPNEKLTDEKPDFTAYLLRVPPASRQNFNAAVQMADRAGKDYTEVVYKIGFDPEAPSPKLTFKPEGLVAEDAFAVADRMFDSRLVHDMVGHPTVRPADEVGAEKPALPPAAPAPKPPRPQLSEDDITDVVAKPAPAPAPKPAPKPAPAPQLGADDIGGLGDEPAPAPAPKARAKPAAPKEAPAPAAPLDEKASALLGDLHSMLGMADD